MKFFLQIFENFPASGGLRPPDPFQADPLKCSPPNRNPGGAADFLSDLPGPLSFYTAPENSTCSTTFFGFAGGGGSLSPCGTLEIFEWLCQILTSFNIYFVSFELPHQKLFFLDDLVLRFVHD